MCCINSRKCDTCLRKQLNSKYAKPLRRLEDQEAAEELYEAVEWNGKEIRVGDSVFLYPDAYGFKQQSEERTQNYKEDVRFY